MQLQQDIEFAIDFGRQRAGEGEVPHLPELGAIRDAGFGEMWVTVLADVNEDGLALELGKGLLGRGFLGDCLIVRIGKGDHMLAPGLIRVARRDFHM